VLAAAILFVPANLLPMMTTASLLGTQHDTIMSGVIFCGSPAPGRWPRWCSSPA
jgi:paraquat-inducible protein A